MYDYGARNYDPALGRWMNIDPLAELTQELYSYVWNSPVIMIDPDGRSGESTIVEDIGDGKYKVVGGDLNDGDKGIYLDDGKGGKGKKIGESLTMYSFYNADTQDDESQQGWKGVIDTSSREVEQFLNEEIIGADVGLFHYMGNAKTDEDLDLKRRENGKKVVYESDGKGGSKRVAKYEKDDREYHHRGSYFGSKIDKNGIVVPIYASARDGGNYAAGWVAGKSRVRWWAAKTMFNALEFKDSYTTEGAQSTLAQKAGHNRGRATLSENIPKN